MSRQRGKTMGIVAFFIVTALIVAPRLYAHLREHTRHVAPFDSEYWLLYQTLVEYAEELAEECAEGERE